MSIDLTSTLISTASDDQEVRAKVKELALKALDEVEDILDHGTPAVKTTVLRSFVPALVREMNKKKEDDEIQELKAQMAELIKEMRSGQEVEIEEEKESGVREDGPIPLFPRKVNLDG